MEALTDASGMVLFEGLPATLHTVWAYADGFYESGSQSVDLRTSCRAELELTLALQAIVEESIVVSPEVQERVQIDAPVRTDVVSGLHCERNATRSLGEALMATVTGVRIENNCNNCGVTALRMNGLQGPYTQFLEDGLPMLSGVSMVYALDQIPTEFVQSIEVVKGGGSAVYGPSAIAGVINLVRREPRGNSGQFSLQSGWHAGRPLQSIGGIAQSSNLPWQLSSDIYYRGTNRTPVDRDGDGFTEISKCCEFRRGLALSALSGRFGAT
jgi:outer membrane receptor for ferrienterochelin and colicins